MMAMDPFEMDVVDVMYIFPDAVVKSILTSSMFSADETFARRLVLMPIRESGFLSVSD